VTGPASRAPPLLDDEAVPLDPLRAELEPLELPVEVEVVLEELLELFVELLELLEPLEELFEELEVLLELLEFELAELVVPLDPVDAPRVVLALDEPRPVEPVLPAVEGVLEDITLLPGSVLAEELA
jgi:hypothetical protein